MNIEVITSTEPRLPRKEPSSTNTAACVRQEADDRINILEFGLDNERQPGKAATPAALRAPDPVIEELEGDPRYRCLRAQIDHDSPHWSQNNCCKSCRKCIHSSSLLMVMSRWQEALASSRIYCSTRCPAESSHNLSSADLRLKCLASHSTHCNAVCVCTLQGSKVTHVTELHNGFRRRSVRQVKDDIPLGLI